MTVQDVQRQIYHYLVRRPREPALFLLSVPLGIPAEETFSRLQLGVARIRALSPPGIAEGPTRELRIVVDLEQRKRPPSFFLFQKVFAEIRRRYPTTWDTVVADTLMASPLTVPPDRLNRAEGYQWLYRVAQTLAWFAGEPPLRLYIYHLERADEWSLETLRYLMSRMTSTPLQIFGLWKPPPDPRETPLAPYSETLPPNIHIFEVSRPSLRELLKRLNTTLPESTLRLLYPEVRRRPLALEALVKGMPGLEDLAPKTLRSWKQALTRQLGEVDTAILFLLSHFTEGLTTRDLRNLLKFPADRIQRQLQDLARRGLVFQDRGYWGASLPNLPLPTPLSDHFRLDEAEGIAHPPLHKARFYEALGFKDRAVEHLVETASTELARGNIDQAVQHLRKARALHPHDLDLLQKEISWLLAYERHDEIRRLIKTLDPANPDHFSLIKHAEASFRPPTDVLRETEEFLQTLENPPNKLFFLAARLALDLRDAERARRYLDRIRREALTSPREQATFWELMGWCHLLLGENREARACYQRVRSLLPKIESPEERASFYNNLAGILLFIGERNQALTYMERAMELAARIGHPSLYQIASMNRFLAYERVQRYREARRILLQTFHLEWFSKAPLHGRLVALMNFQLIEFRLGKFETAAYVYRKLHPHYYRKFPFLLLDAAETYVHSLHTFEGHADEIHRVLKDFRELLAEMPEELPENFEPLLQYLEAIWMVEQGRLEEALQVFQTLRETLHPQRSRYLKAAVTAFLGETLVLLGRIQKGLRYFNEALEEIQKHFASEVPYYRFLKVQALIQAGVIPVQEMENLEKDLHEVGALDLARRVRELRERQGQSPEP